MSKSLKNFPLYSIILYVHTNEKSILGLSMHDREFSPEGVEFNREVDKAMSLVILDPRVRVLYFTWTLMMESYTPSG